MGIPLEKAALVGHLTALLDDIQVGVRDGLGGRDWLPARAPLPRACRDPLPTSISHLVIAYLNFSISISIAASAPRFFFGAQAALLARALAFRDAHITDVKR